MRQVSNTFLANQSAPVRTVNAKVEVYNGSTLVTTYTKNDKIISLEIQRVADEGKFFGQVFISKLNLKLDNVAKSSLSAGYRLRVSLGFGTEYLTYPDFLISEIHCDEVDNSLSITAYDSLYKLKEIAFSSLQMSYPYTLDSLLEAFRTHGILFNKTAIPSAILNTLYKDEEGYRVNIEATTPVFDVLSAIALATGSIIYIYQADLSVTWVNMKPLKDLTTSLAITKEDYYELTYKGNKRLQKVVSETELGDNVETHITTSGSTQRVYENPLWNLRSDIGTILENSIKPLVCGMVIGQFEMTWFGNVALEPGDKIQLTDKDDNTFTSYVLDDVITYDGSLRETTRWYYEKDDSAVEANSATIGESLSKTFARVDKVNKEITLRVEDTDARVAQLQIDADGLTSTVEGTVRVSKQDSPPQNPNNGDIWEYTVYGSVRNYYRYEGDTWNEITADEAANIKRVNTLAQTLDGVIFDNGSGTTVINGDNITTGTISADRINMTGAITWSDMNSDMQTRINSGRGIYRQSTVPSNPSNGDLWYVTGHVSGYTPEKWYTYTYGSGWELVGSDAELPDYIKDTYIDSVEIRSPTISGNTINMYGGTFNIKNASGTTQYGFLGKGNGNDGVSVTDGVILSYGISSGLGIGDYYLICTSRGVRMTAGQNSLYVTGSGVYKTINGVDTPLGTCVFA